MLHLYLVENIRILFSLVRLGLQLAKPRAGGCTLDVLLLRMEGMRLGGMPAAGGLAGVERADFLNFPFIEIENLEGLL